MTKMNPAIKAKWVAALRSGEYKQGQQALRSEQNRFCCLGVLCNLHAQAHPKVAAEQSDQRYYIDSKNYPAEQVFQWAGLETRNPWVDIDGKFEPLACHNDEGKSFAKIADAIEEQL